MCSFCQSNLIAFLFFLLCFTTTTLCSQVDSINILQPVAVSAVSSDERSPFANTNLSQDDLNSMDAGQDMPFLLRLTPSVVVTSDAGNGIGYTGIRLRGSDASRINVTINGVPLNDAESQGVFWVNLPDLGASVSGLQIQRGVGTSTNGSGAFGGSIAINTLGKIVQPGGQVVLGGGSFNSFRRSVGWNTGIVGKGWNVEGRMSQIGSDGYVDRASSDLNSIYTSVAKRWGSGRFSITSLRGNERTYQSWFGIPQFITNENVTDADIDEWAMNSSEYGYGFDVERLDDLKERGRQHNYYNYKDEVDNYYQNHLQLHFEQDLGLANMAVSLFSTLGAGYYEQFRSDDAFSVYGLEAPTYSDSISPESTNVIRRRWLDNTLAGGLVNFDLPLGKVDVQFGGAYSNYSGDHFGELIWMEHAADVLPGTRYYDNVGDKQDGSAYVRGSYDLMDEKVRLQAELQTRYVTYSTHGVDADLREISIEDTLLFFNPKFGFDVLLSESSRAFASVAIANREPARSDYLDTPNSGSVNPEQLKDFELGYKYVASKWSVEMGLYHMSYKDQLIATGALNDVGSPVRVNVPKSYRQGIEIQAGVEIMPKIRCDVNVTLSQNRIDLFEETIYDYDENYDYVNVVDHQNSDIAFSPSVTGSGVISAEVWSNTNSTIGCDFVTKFVGQQFLDNTSNIDRSLPAYFVNDFSVQWSTTRTNNDKISLSIVAKNILDKMYSANGWTYSYLSGGFDSMVTENYVFPQAGRHGFINIVYSF